MVVLAHRDRQPCPEKPFTTTSTIADCICTSTILAPNHIDISTAHSPGSSVTTVQNAPTGRNCPLAQQHHTTPINSKPILQHQLCDRERIHEEYCTWNKLRSLPSPESCIPEDHGFKFQIPHVIFVKNNFEDYAAFKAFDG